MIFAGFGDLARLPWFWLTVFFEFHIASNTKTPGPWLLWFYHQIFASGTATRRLGKLWEHEKFGQCNAVASTRLKRLEQRSIARAVVSVYFPAIIITYTLLLFYLAAVRILLAWGTSPRLGYGAQRNCQATTNTSAAPACAEAWWNCSRIWSCTAVARSAWKHWKPSMGMGQQYASKRQLKRSVQGFLITTRVAVWSLALGGGVSDFSFESFRVRVLLATKTHFSAGADVQHAAQHPAEPWRLVREPPGRPAPGRVRGAFGAKCQAPQDRSGGLDARKKAGWWGAEFYHCFSFLTRMIGTLFTKCFFF